MLLMSHPGFNFVFVQALDIRAIVGPASRTSSYLYLTFYDVNACFTAVGKTVLCNFPTTTGHCIPSLRSRECSRSVQAEYL